MPLACLTADAPRPPVVADSSLPTGDATVNLARRAGPAVRPPFPIHGDLVASLLAAHRDERCGHDPRVAHVLGTLAAWSYGDTDTVATMASRLGLEGNACVRLAQTVDAMLVFSTAYLLQSRCGRVVVLCYRGTEPATLGSWLGDADVGAERMTIAGESCAVHSGFRRNMRSTRHGVLEELRRALAGRSLLDPARSVDHPLEALYVTGHSLGGAMAVLFALSLTDDPELRDLVSRLRAVYTFGQPLVACEPLPAATAPVVARLVRYVTARDLVPALPAAAWGRLTHFGEEYRHVEGAWRRSPSPVEQLVNVAAIPRSILAFFATAKRRGRSRYTIAEHAPHHYLAALRPAGLVTELGDRD